MRIIIPARAGSKGLPRKNRLLLRHTLDIIPEKYLEHTIVTTDDKHVASQSERYKVEVIDRSEELASDTASIRDVMQDAIEKSDINDSDDVVMLYLTYPERTWENVLNSFTFYQETRAKSLLCKREIKTHPYLCLEECGEHEGTQITKHNLYRRQDYPKCFEVSHFICIFKPSELKNLNKNMYNKNTKFYKIDDVVDVDTLKDLGEFYDKNNC